MQIIVREYLYPDQEHWSNVTLEQGGRRGWGGARGGRTSSHSHCSEIWTWDLRPEVALISVLRAFAGSSPAWFYLLLKSLPRNSESTQVPLTWWIEEDN